MDNGYKGVRRAVMGEIGAHIATEDIRKGEVLRIEGDPAITLNGFGKRRVPVMHMLDEASEVPPEAWRAFRSRLRMPRPHIEITECIHKNIVMPGILACAILVGVGVLIGYFL